ncbi:MAG: adenylate/guanylate cyclase domain-containing protein [Deferrisomatales bacterium]
MELVTRSTGVVFASSLVPAAVAVSALNFDTGWGPAALAAAAVAGLLTLWQWVRRPRPGAVAAPAAPAAVGAALAAPPDNFVARLGAGVEAAVVSLWRSTGQPPPSRDAVERELDRHLGWLLRHRKLFSPTHEAREVTVVISDLRGFASISEYYSAAEVIDLLNRYFHHMGQAISKYQGVVDKYMGDSIIILFGVPEKGVDDVHNAVCCAAEMQIAMRAFNHENELRGLPHLHMGIGINTGQVIAGRLGSDLHSEYTVIGDQVNLASRIEAASLRGQVLMSEHTYSRVQDQVTVRGPIHVSVKGKRTEVQLYELQQVHAPCELVVPEREVRRSVRADVNIPFRFQLCEGKIVLRDGHEGRILNLSAGGMFFCTLAPVEPQQTVKFQLSRRFLGKDTTDIYGKVLRVRPNGSVYDANVEFTFIDPEDAATIGALVDATVKPDQAE